MTNQLKIGELAAQAGCLVETIRYYEKKGLLPAPARNLGNYRMYNDVYVDRLSFIRHCRSLDMTLDEIRTLLTFRDAPEENCGEVNSLLDEHISHVAHRVAELKTLERQLKKLRQLCDQAHAAKDCGILNELTQEATSVSSKSRTKPMAVDHVHGSHQRGNH